jgi:hypothetical protein
MYPLLVPHPNFTFPSQHRGWTASGGDRGAGQAAAGRRHAQDCHEQARPPPQQGPVVSPNLPAKINWPPLQHWILDGFPRTVGQGELLDAHLKFVALVHDRTT